MTCMDLRIESQREDDGRWFAEVSGLPGVNAYGDTRDAAMVKAEALAFRVLAEWLENSETKPVEITLSFARRP
jgi:predicted RNase H-like HicB family nuclease